VIVTGQLTEYWPTEPEAIVVSLHSAAKDVSKIRNDQEWSKGDEPLMFPVAEMTQERMERDTGEYDYG
jgi:hypothetical protein